MDKKSSMRLARIVLLAVVAGATAPAMAFDTGGGGASTTTSAPGKPAKAKTATPTLEGARADIAAKNWSKAIAELKLFVGANGKNADGYNLLGYAYRNSGNYDLAGKAYARALKLDPKHTGALEYQGVLFLKLGQVDKAKANLAKIKAISGEGSEECQDLAKAIG